MRSRSCSIFALVVLLAACWQASCVRGAQGSAPAEVLTNVVSIRRLTPDEASEERLVRVEAVVTYHQPRRHLTFIQDDTGGSYVSGGSDPSFADFLQAGRRVVVEGRTRPGRFAPFIGATNFAGAGTALLPEPVRVSIDQLADPQHHSQFIEVPGVIRAVSLEQRESYVTSDLMLTIGSPSGRFDAVIVSPRVPRVPQELVGATVKVRGVYGSLFNERRQLVGMTLYVASLDDVQVERAADENPFELPIRPVEKLMQFETDRSAAERVRVRGVVTLCPAASRVFIDDGRNGVLVETTGLANLRPGEEIEVVGFPAWGEWSPVLQDAIWRKVGEAGIPAAAPITAAEALTGEHDSRRVRIEAELLESSRFAERAPLVMQAGGRTFTARFAEARDVRDLPEISAGTRLQLTGICLNRRGQDFLNTFRGFSRGQIVAKPASFEMLLSSPADVAVLQTPNWWTTSRLLTAMGTLTTLALAAFGWIVTLRRRVTAQTAVIKAQLERETLQEERARISRELHDTVEQELTGLSLQLDAASDTLSDSPQVAQTALHSAQALLKHTRGEVRRSVWDLRTAALEGNTLPAALRETMRQFGGNGSPEIEVAVEGSIRPLPARLESHLLRIATEAATNAVKHSQATRIGVRLTFSETEVIVTVSDDGRGFDRPTNTIANGHFGFAGMKERAERVGGELKIRSEPGAGTTVELRVKFSEIV